MDMANVKDILITEKSLMTIVGVKNSGHPIEQGMNGADCEIFREINKQLSRRTKRMVETILIIIGFICLMILQRELYRQDIKPAERDIVERIVHSTADPEYAKLVKISSDETK